MTKEAKEAQVGAMISEAHTEYSIQEVDEQKKKRGKTLIDPNTDLNNVS